MKVDKGNACLLSEIKMRYSRICACIFSLLIACEQKEEKPDFLWEEDRFVEVLTEFQITESIIRLGYHRFPDSSYATDSIYAALYQELGVTEAEFDSNYHYHIKDPEKMAKLYEQVITRLSERSAEAAQKKN